MAYVLRVKSILMGKAQWQKHTVICLNFCGLEIKTKSQGSSMPLFLLLASISQVSAPPLNHLDVSLPGLHMASLAGRSLGCGELREGGFTSMAVGKP